MAMVVVLVIMMICIVPLIIQNLVYDYFFPFFSHLLRGRRQSCRHQGVRVLEPSCAFESLEKGL